MAARSCSISSRSRCRLEWFDNSCPNCLPSSFSACRWTVWSRTTGPWGACRFRQPILRGLCSSWGRSKQAHFWCQSALEPAATQFLGRGSCRWSSRWIRPRLSILGFLQDQIWPKSDLHFFLCRSWRSHFGGRFYRGMRHRTFLGCLTFSLSFGPISPRQWWWTWRRQAKSLWTNWEQPS